jgi:hypothetical protein
MTSPSSLRPSARIRLNAWNRALYDALAPKDLGEFLDQLMVFGSAVLFGKITFGYVQESPDGTLCSVGMAADRRVTGSPEG